MTPVYQEKLHNSLWLWKMVKCRAGGVKLTFKINDSDKEALKISKLLSQNRMQKNEIHFHEMKMYLIYNFFKIEISVS